jgi:hypothetical protein
VRRDGRFGPKRVLSGEVAGFGPRGDDCNARTACARTGSIAGWVYNRRMDQQLIIKFWRKSLADEAFLATIEDELKAVLGKTVELEGYDVSAKEINLFMLTADPRHSFRRAKDILEGKGIHNGMSAAFRLVGGAKFTSIWPLRSTRKFTLP